MVSAKKPRLTVGASLLSLVTLGISDSPLVMYREYIQNAADALASSGCEDGGQVNISIDRKCRQVLIRDNGPGLSHQECLDNLVPIGRSKKKRGVDRGFRGIGRLSGLAFADSVSFLTRTREDEPVTRVEWLGARSMEWAAAATFADDSVRNLVSIHSDSGTDYPDHFFEVQVHGVSRQAAGIALNRDAVKEFIGEVCPVPLATSFRYKRDVTQLFDPPDSPYTLKITVGDDHESVQRQYGVDIPFSRDRRGEFTEFEPIRIARMDGQGEAAVGWVAHSTYLGSIPKGGRIRGIRARVGNMQIGGERVFDHLFQDDRFNRWCVGELHIVDDRIVPNARRDYFEPGPHLKHLENHLSAALLGVEKRCKAASSARSRTKRVEDFLISLEQTRELAASGYLSPADARKLVEKAHSMIPAASKLVREIGAGKVYLDRLESVEQALDALEATAMPDVFGDMCPGDIEVYQRICRALVEALPAVGMVNDVMAHILGETGTDARN